MTEETQKIQMDGLKIEAWDLDRLIPAKLNHKKHSEETTTRLARSLADIGQIQPVIVDKDCEIIAGHGRLMAAKKLGWEKIKVIQVPVSREVAIKARIADNLMSNQNIHQENLTAEIKILESITDDLDMDSLFIDSDFAELQRMGAKDDYGIDEESFSKDISKDADAFVKENEEMMVAAEDGTTPLKNVFGFTNVSTSQARVLKDFMAQVISETGETEPADALVKWVDEVMS